MIDKITALCRFIPKGEFSSATWECLNVADGQVTATDFTVAASSFIPELKGFEFNVPAHKFSAAVGSCKEPKLSVQGDVLTIRDGKFKVEIQLVMTPYVTIQEPTGDGIKPPAPFIPALRVIQPFVGSSAKRPNLQAVALREGFAYATDGTVAVRIPGPSIPGVPVVMPSRAVTELLKAGVEPSKIVLTENRATFFYGERDWVQTNLLDTQFPDIDKILETAKFSKDPLPSGLREGLDLALRFAEGEFTPVAFEPGKLRAGSAEYGIEGLPPSRWNGQTLRDVLAVAETMNFAAWPEPAGWTGEDGLKGILCGLR